MKKLRTHLLTTAAVVAASGSAFAADMGPPVKAPLPAPIPYAQFQGWYLGGAIGAARLNVSATQTFGSTGICGNDGATGTSDSCTTSATGFTAGVQAGYDWQSRYFVYGVVADWTWTGLKHTLTSTPASAPTSITFIQAKVDWLATFRGRMGLAVDDTLVYFTGGLALAELKSSVGHPNCDSVKFCLNGLSKVQAGWVAGLGVEHKLTQNWSVFSEFLYHDFGHASASTTSKSGLGYTHEFTHEIFQGKVGVNYRF